MTIIMRNNGFQMISTTIPIIETWTLIEWTWDLRGFQHDLTNQNGDLPRNQTWLAMGTARLQDVDYRQICDFLASHASPLEIHNDILSLKQASWSSVQEGNHRGSRRSNIGWLAFACNCLISMYLPPCLQWPGNHTWLTSYNTTIVCVILV